MTQEEAIKTVDRIFNYCEEIDCHLPEDEQTGYEMYPDIIAVMEYIRNTPEVVRCKDCKHRDRKTYINVVRRDLFFCNLHKEEVWATEFCSYGERKEAE